MGGGHPREGEPRCPHHADDLAQPLTVRSGDHKAALRGAAVWGPVGEDQHRQLLEADRAALPPGDAHHRVPLVRAQRAQLGAERGRLGRGRGRGGPGQGQAQRAEQGEGRGAAHRPALAGRPRWVEAAALALLLGCGGPPPCDLDCEAAALE
ncbi:MAG: hypothetical protein ACK559_04255, partial [bacterium]